MGASTSGPVDVEGDVPGPNLVLAGPRLGRLDEVERVGEVRECP